MNSANTGFAGLEEGPEVGLEPKTNKGPDLGPGPVLNFMGLNTGPNAVPTFSSDFMSTNNLHSQPNNRAAANIRLAAAEAAAAKAAKSD